MGQFNAKAIPGQVMTGNAVMIMAGLQEVGYGQAAAFNVGFHNRIQHGIFSQKPQEIQSQKFTPTVTLSMFALSSVGVSVLNFPSSLLDVFATSTINMVIMDARGLPIYIFEGCYVEEFDLNIQVNRPVVQRIQFFAMDVLDDLGMSVLVGDPYVAAAEQAAAIVGLVNKNAGVGII